MKVLYIHHEYRNRRARYADEMRKLGHEVLTITVKGKTVPSQIAYKHIKKRNPDLIFLLSPFYISKGVITPQAIDYIKSKKIPLAVYSTLDTQTAYIEQDHVWKHFDFFFCQNELMTRYLQDIGVNAHYIPMGFYPDQYPPKRSRKDINVSFMGSVQTKVAPKRDRRVEYVKSLSDKGIKVYSKSFNSRGVKGIAYNSHAEQLDVYARSKINLDLPFINSELPFYSTMYHQKNRFFEVPASGNFLLTAYCREFVDILDKDMVGYFDGTIDDMRAKVDYYLSNQEVANKMAVTAFHEVVGKHTFGHRFRAMFDVMGSYAWNR